jgi:hypothetical protein
MLRRPRTPPQPDLLEIIARVMLFLLFDISLYNINKVFAYRESFVCALPFKEFTYSDLVSHQVG